MKTWLIHLLGGFTKGEVLTEAVKKLYNTINEDDILHEENGVWFYKGKQLSGESKKMLIAEAIQLKDSKLWEILSTDIEYQANKQMFLKATEESHLMAGKMFLYVLDVVKTRLKSMSRESGDNK